MELLGLEVSLNDLKEYPVNDRNSPFTYHLESFLKYESVYRGKIGLKIILLSSTFIISRLFLLMLLR